MHIEGECPLDRMGIAAICWFSAVAELFPKQKKVEKVILINFYFFQTNRYFSLT